MIMISVQASPPETPFRIVDRVQVDGNMWYTISAHTRQVREWIMAQDADTWYSHSGGPVVMYDIHEKLYTLLTLKWTQ